MQLTWQDRPDSPYADYTSIEEVQESILRCLNNSALSSIAFSRNMRKTLTAMAENPWLEMSSEAMDNRGPKKFEPRVAMRQVVIFAWPSKFPLCTQEDIMRDANFRLRWASACREILGMEWGKTEGSMLRSAEVSE